MARELKAKRVFLVGMNCDEFLSHDKDKVVLTKEYGNVKLAHEGQLVELKYD